MYLKSTYLVFTNFKVVCVFISFVFIRTSYSLPMSSEQIGSNEFSFADTLYGKLRGSRQKVNDQISLDVFLGIPYAKPPTDNLRWTRPEFPSPWKGTKDALKFGNQCVQRVMEHAPKADTPFSEDCLFMNIYAPRYNDSTDKLPVMFWIHGGGYYGGTGAVFNGTELALRGVVVVNINYRLDVFGFLSTADSVIPGNFGMLDQVLALEWVRDNIAAFGGDPNDVTIFGQSAGSSSVSLHLLSPLSRGKFHKAIMESGVSLCQWAVNPSNTTYYAPKAMAQLLGLAVGCSHQKSKDLLTCLRRMKVDYLINASIAIETSLRDAMVWVPVVETTFGFLPDTPINLYKRGAVADVPTIRGYNKNELGISIKDPDNQGYSLSKFAELLVTTSYFFFQKNDLAVAAAIEAVYIANQTNAIGRRSDFERLMTDLYMVAPITYEAQLHGKLQQKSKSYLYEFSYRASFDSLPPWMGVVHADELPFVFGLPRGPAQLAYNTTDPNDIQVAGTMVTLWTNFAKTGNPTPQAEDHNGQSDQTYKSKKAKEMSSTAVNSGVVWPAVNENSKAVLDINTQLNVGDFARSRAVELWMVTIPRLQEL